jgi:hypothetical protein
MPAEGLRMAAGRGPLLTAAETRRKHRMQRISVVVVAALLALPVPALAAVSQAQRTACEKAAETVRPALRAGEKEAWIANCLADATPKKGGNY